MGRTKGILLFILLWSVVAESLSAQSTKIGGVVTDSKTQEAIPFASIAVYTPESQDLIDGTITHDNGHFEIENINFGEYQLVISFIGYKTDTLSGIILSREAPIISLGEIHLISAAVKLEGVEIVGLASTGSRKVDRQTYRAEHFETTRGGTATDVLSRLPSMSVDNEGEISLRGTTDFTVYLNGKPVQMEASVLLGQIPANSIESIDVITVPTARFEAQGSGGIVNIITKKSRREGLSVVVDGMAGGLPWANKTHAYSDQYLNYDRWGGGVNLSYQKDKLNFFGNLNYSTRNLKSSRTGDARLLQSDGSYYHMVAEGERLEWQKNYGASAGMDYYLDSTSVLSALYYYGHRNKGRTAHYVYHNYFADIDKNESEGIDPFSHYVYNPNYDDRNGNFHTGSIDYNKNLGQDARLHMSLLYEHSGLSWSLDNPEYKFDAINDKPEELTRRFLQADNTPLEGMRISVDYEKKLKNGQSIGIGLQPQFLKHTGDFNFDTLRIASNTWETQQEFNNHIDLKRAIYAGYMDYSGNWEKLGYRAGIRFEYTDQLMEIKNPDYLNIFQRPTQPAYRLDEADWFPSLHVSYAFNERNSLILAASQRINRPPTKDMAPFLYRRHHEVYVVGDPALKPEYLKNAELTYVKGIGDQQLTFTGFYRGTDHAISRANTVFKEENVLIRSYTNSGNVRALGAEVNANLIAGSFARFMVGGSLYDFNVQGDIFGFKENNRSTNWSVKGNMNLFLRSDLRFTLDVDLRSATVTTQGRNELFYLSNAAMNYTPTKLPDWSFGIKVIDLLGSNSQGVSTRAYDSSRTQIFYQETEIDRSGPIFELVATYSLNKKGKSERKAEATFGEEQF